MRAFWIPGHKTPLRVLSFSFSAMTTSKKGGAIPDWTFHNIHLVEVGSGFPSINLISLQSFVLQILADTNLNMFQMLHCYVSMLCAESCSQLNLQHPCYEIDFGGEDVALLSFHPFTLTYTFGYYFLTAL